MLKEYLHLKKTLTFQHFWLLLHLMVHLQKPSIYWVLHCPKQCNANESGAQYPRGTLQLQVLQYCQTQYLKPPHSSKENIRRWLASLHLRIIPHDNMMHQGEQLLVVLCLQCKMTFMGSVGHKKRTYHSYILLQKSTMSSAERVVYKTKIKWVRKCKDTPCCNSHWYSIGMKMMDQT